MSEMQSCRYLTSYISFLEDKIGFCCRAASCHQPIRPLMSYKDTAEKTAEAFLARRHALISELSGNIPLDKAQGCIGCKLLKPCQNDSRKQLSHIMYAFYPSPCQARCIYCAHRGHRLYGPGDMKLNFKEAAASPIAPMIAGIIDYLKKQDHFSPNTTASVGSGEITIHPHKELLINSLSGIKSAFFTNAIVFDEQIAHHMRKYKSFINVSIDSGTSGTYRTIKGGDWFRQVVRNLYKYRDYGNIRLRYNVIPGINDSDDDINGVVDLLKSIGMDYLFAAQETGMPLNECMPGLIKIYNACEFSGKKFTGVFPEVFTADLVQEHAKKFDANVAEAHRQHLYQKYKNEYVNDYFAYQDYVHSFEHNKSSKGVY